MVRLRLRRVGRKKQPSYRVVAADREAPRDGRFLEVVGFYNPRTEPSTITLKEDRVFHWLSVGAQPSDAVESLFRQMGTRDRYDRFKAGEEIETLLEEYKVVEETRNTTSKTRVDGKPKVSKKKAKAAAEAAEAEKAAAEKAAAEEAAKAAEAEAEAEEAETVEEVVEEAAEAVAETAEEVVEEVAEAVEEVAEEAAEAVEEVVEEAAEVVEDAAPEAEEETAEEAEEAEEEADEAEEEEDKEE
jgi:small subunit ribosomal protein S16